MSKVLLIEDNQGCASFMETVLQRAGYSVESHSTACEALSNEKSQFVDLIITDLMMPGLSGVDLLRELRQRAPSVPLLVVSGTFAAENEMELMSAGATACLGKPFSYWDLLEAVDRLVLRTPEHNANSSY